MALSLVLPKKKPAVGWFFFFKFQIKTQKYSWPKWPTLPCNHLKIGKTIKIRKWRYFKTPYPTQSQLGSPVYSRFSRYLFSTDKPQYSLTLCGYFNFSALHCILLSESFTCLFSPSSSVDTGCYTLKVYARWDLEIAVATDKNFGRCPFKWWQLRDGLGVRD